MKFLFSGFIFVEAVNPIVKFIRIHIIGPYAADVEIVGNSVVEDFGFFFLEYIYYFF